MELTQGAELDRYVVDGLIGTGGMARVYRARHGRLGSWHAVKVLRLPTPSVIERLLREGRAQSSLVHPHIVPVTDVIDVGGCPGLVMPYVPGPHLAALCRETHLPLADVAALGRDVLSGVAAAHAAGWVHRDLKPANVLLATVDGKLVPRVTDFGLAKALAPDAPVAGTASGVLMGTPAYMAPEQFTDARRVDRRVDVYALGILLFELCTGHRPYPGDDPLDLLARARAGQLPSACAERPELPAGLDALLAAAVHPDADARPPGAQDLLEGWEALPWPGGPMSDATLAAAVEATPAVQPLERGSSTVPATLTVEDPFEVATSADGSLSSPPRSGIGAARERRRWAGWMAGGALLVGLALGAAQWVVGTEPAAASRGPVLTSQGAPRIDADPALQDHFDRGWRAFLDGDRHGALRHLEAVPDHPLPALLRSYVLMRDGEVVRSLELASRDAERFRDAPGPGGELVRAVAAQRTQGRVDAPEIAAYRQAHPDDLFARMMEADHCAMVSAAACEAQLPALLEAAPRSAEAYRIAAGSWQELNRPAEERAVVAEGLQVSPSDPFLLELQAIDVLNQGDLAEAEATLQRLQALDPTSLSVKSLRVRRAILAADAELHDALRQELTSPSQPLAARQTYYRTASDTLLGLGRARDAWALWAEARAQLGTDEGTERVDTFLRQRGAALSSGDLVAAQAALEEATRIVRADPSVPPNYRDPLEGYLLYVEVLGAARAGDVPLARELVARVIAAEATPETIEAARRALAIAEGDAEQLLSLVETLWRGECQRRAIVGDALVRAGDPVRAQEALREADATCHRYNGERALAVLALVALAEATDGPEARELVARARSLWPDPDPDHITARRLRALEARLAVQEGPDGL